MKLKKFPRILVLFLCLVVVVNTLSLCVFAGQVDESKLKTYRVVSEQNWELTPGVTEYEIILNNAAGNKQQVTHVVEIDVINSDVKVIPSYKGMAEGINAKNYGTQIMSEQAKYAEENGYGDVVVAMNTCLHWYDTDYYAKHPELIGEPLGTLILDGVRYTNSQNSFFGAYTCVVINFDEKDGQPRPDSIPKVQIRQTYDAITGWEEQLIPASFHFLVKDGVNQHSINDPEPYAPRSMMGIKEDGTLVLVMVEGRQAPYSTGFNAYEMAEYMISLGCVQAINCDGGGSSTFLSQRPGEELELHCYPSDGKERPVTQGVLVISPTHMCKWENEKIITPATCTENGEKSYTCECGETTNKEIIAPGHIDENGDLSCDICSGKLSVKTGLVFEKNGDIRYYVNGASTRAGLVVDSQGNYYYINSTLKAVKNCSYSFNAAMGNGLLPGGTYQFDATGKMINPPTGKLPHVHVWGEGTDSATCTEGGIRTYICGCGLSKNEATPALGHIDETDDFHCDNCEAVVAHECVWDDGEVTTLATCTEEGVKTYTCKCGESKTEAVPVADHIDETGDFRCDNCTAVVAHECVWDNGEITAPANCTEEGVKTYTCKCGENKTESVPVADHIDETGDFRCDNCTAVVAHECVWDNGVVTTPATCTVDGVKTYTCKCGETKTETVKAIGSHIDENGDLSCDRCSEKLSAKTGLVFEKNGDIRYYENGVAIISKGLVQDSEGNYYYINSTGKAVKNCTYAFAAARANGLLPAGSYKFAADGKMINPPAGKLPHIHVWGDGIVTDPAICTEGGIRTYICECGLGKIEAIAALDHIDENENFVCDREECGEKLPHECVWDNGVVTDPASCTEDGVKTYTCKCGETKTESVPAPGHLDADENYYCDRCGTAVEHVHVWDDGEVTTLATCTEEGVKTYICKCGETDTEVVPALGHNDETDDFHCDICGDKIAHECVWGNGVVTTPATCTVDGVKTYTCKCGETKTETVKAIGSHIDENGDLSCDRCSEKLSAKTGLVFEKNGDIRYYENGVAIISKGLVQDSEGNYYYINSTGKAVKNCTYAFAAARANGLLPAGSYQFAADGKLILK